MPERSLKLASEASSPELAIQIIKMARDKLDEAIEEAYKILRGG